MARSVYLETTIFSYLASRPSRDLIVAAHQQITWQWWEKRRADFSLFISQTVTEEILRGDETLAKKRFELIKGISRLEANASARDITKQLIQTKTLPKNAAEDAAHLAIASVHGVEYLLTWNCKHLANAEIISLAEEVILQMGYKAPRIYTPAQLVGE